MSKYKKNERNLTADNADGRGFLWRFCAFACPKCCAYSCRRAREYLLVAVILYGSVLISSAKAGTLDIGAELASLHYKEPGLMREDGILAGIYARYSGMLITNFTGNILLSCTGGSVKYDGSTMAGIPIETNSSDYLLNLRALLEYQIQFITPFTGISIRFLDDDLASGSSYGYERQTIYLYSPLGMKISGTFGNNWTLGAQGEYDLFWAGLNRNLDYPLTTGTATIELRQRSGYGMQTSVFLQHPISKTFGLSMEIFLRYWNIDTSDSVLVYDPTAVYALFEPANECMVYGLRAGMLW